MSGKRRPIASSFGPVSGLAPVKFRWSSISMTSPGRNSGSSAPAALVTTSRSAPEPPQQPHGQRDVRRRPALVEMQPPLHQRHPPAVQPADHQPPGMARRGGDRKAGDLRVGDRRPAPRPRRRAGRARSRGSAPPPPAARPARRSRRAPPPAAPRRSCARLAAMRGASAVTASSVSPDVERGQHPVAHHLPPADEDMPHVGLGGGEDDVRQPGRRAAPRAAAGRR